MTDDYIPRNDAEFSEWFRNLADYAMRKTSGATPECKRVPQWCVYELIAAYGDWYWNVNDAPALRFCTAPTTAATKNDARIRAEKAIRRFLQFEPIICNADN